MNSRRRFLVAAGFVSANVALGSQLRQTASSPISGGGGSINGPIDQATGQSAVSPALADAGPEPGPDHVFDLLLTNARVIDPETGFDAEAEVGINDGVITAIRGPGNKTLEILDCGGQVVAPGFIDILSAEPNDFGEWLKVADGVTTNLAMHGVNNYANAFFGRYTGVSPVHFGGAFHQHFLRSEDLGVAPDQPLTDAQLAELVELARFNLSNGFSGICFSPEYSPGTSTAEIEALAGVCAEFGHDTFFHVRYSDPDAPGTSFEAIAEVIEVARRTGVGVHIEHIASTGGTFVMRETLDILEQARGEGLDVTACVYPYDYWATTLGSFRFAPGWEDRYRIGVDALQVAGTEGRLDAGSFQTATAENKLVAAHGSIPEEEVQMALQTPWIMVSSDAILTPSLNNHPRASGTFARTLGLYVRELGVLGLSDALAKMTVLPANRMVSMIPQMARKGRLQRGADADITIFDPDTVADQATVAQPGNPSVGISNVLVSGQFVMRNGELLRQARPGEALLSSATA